MDRKDTGYSENSIGAWLLIALAVYLVRIMPWALAEYWYDEVLTLGEFVLDPRGKGLWGGVFRTYPIANNHILSTALYWIWVRVLNFGSRLALTIIDVLATDPPSSVSPAHRANLSYYLTYSALNGKWNASSRALPSSSVLAVVTMVMSMPRVRSILS